MKAQLLQFQECIPDDLDAVLITSPRNRWYLTGFSSSAGTLLLTKDKRCLLVDNRYFEAAKAADTACEVILQEKLLVQIAEIFQKNTVKTVGIESQFVTVSELETWKEAFPEVHIATDARVSKQIMQQRTIKSECALGRMRAAQQITDQCFLHILGFLEVGRTEREIATEMNLFCMRQGAEGPSFSTIVASGKHSSMPHAAPTEKPLAIGDFVTMDFGCVVDGYCSDMTRTVAMGAVHARQKACYDVVLSAQMAALDQIKGGVACSEVDQVARDIIDASPFQGCFTHGLGHCLGMDVHEPPYMNKTSQDTLLPGMVTSVEPGIYLPGEFGVRIEDCVIVTKQGREVLAKSTKELIIL